MELKLLTPRISLNKSYLKTKTSRSFIDQFKRNLIHVLDTIDEFESEEFHKNMISDFLKNTWYGAAHFINTKDRKDLVVYKGRYSSKLDQLVYELYG